MKKSIMLEFDKPNSKISISYGDEVREILKDWKTDEVTEIQVNYGFLNNLVRYRIRNGSNYRGKGHLLFTKELYDTGFMELQGNIELFEILKHDFEVTVRRMVKCQRANSSSG